MHTLLLLAAVLAAQAEVFREALPDRTRAQVLATLRGVCCENKTYLELIRIVSSNLSDAVYLKGGVVRDLVRTGGLAGFLDIDIGFNTPFDRVKQRLSAAGVKHLFADSVHYVKVGPVDGAHLDGTGMYGSGATGYEISDVETPANALMLQMLPHAMVLTDILGGAGLADARALVWRSPHAPGSPAFRRWVEEHDKADTASHRLLWRMMKFKLRNFTVPDSTAAAIYSYWLERRHRDEPQWEKVWTLISTGKAAAVADVAASDLKRLKLRYTYDDFVQTLVERRMLYRLFLGREVAALSPACPPGVVRHAGVCLIPSTVPSRTFKALALPAFCCAREDEL